MTEYRQNLAVLQSAFDKATPGAIALCRDKIDQAASSGDRALIDRIVAALPALAALSAAYEAATPATQEAFDERIDKARVTLDAGRIADLAAEIALATPTP